MKIDVAKLLLILDKDWYHGGDIDEAATALRLLAAEVEAWRSRMEVESGTGNLEDRRARLCEARAATDAALTLPGAKT